MHETVVFLVNTWLKLFFLLTPFFALSMFLSLTKNLPPVRRRRLALQTAGAGAVICLVLFFFGRVVFSLFGITLDAFRVGAGTLLLVSAVAAIRDQQVGTETALGEDVAVVPLAMPIIVGPATPGTLLVMGAEIPDTFHKLVACGAVLLAVFAVGLLLLAADAIERRLGSKGVKILGKITSIFLAALAAEMILTGIGHRLGVPAP
ncbi:MAG: MarC family protein [bacterium]